MNLEARQGEDSPHIFTHPSVELERRHDGTVVFRSTVPIGLVPRSAPDLLDRQAASTPDRAYLRQRVGGDGAWRQITYAEMVDASRRFAQWLLDTGHQRGDAIAVLSGPSIEHVVILLGAQRVGVAAASLSVNFSLMGQPSEKLRACMAAIKARYAFVDDAMMFRDAMHWLARHDVSFLVDGPSLPDQPSVSFKDACARTATSEVDTAFAEIGADTVARIMFTSGSTGMPKAVGLTHGNLMASVAQMDALGFLPKDGEKGPQVLDFMPHSHVFSGTAGLNNALRAGATIHLDAGKPTSQHFHQTIANLREVSPSWFATAPLGYSMLVDAMDADPELRKCFFRDLRYMLFSGATLPRRVRDRLDDQAKQEVGHVIPMTSAYGSTEILASTFVHWDNTDTTIIGVPAPGVEIKLVPREGKLEILARGPNVMTRNGYIGDPAANAAAFDEEGFFRTGDAAELADQANPEAGLRFDGRFGEQFKLTSATYVAAGTLRLKLIEAFEPLLREVCPCGENEDYLAAFAWLNEQAVSTLFPHLESADASGMIRDCEILAWIEEKLAEYNDTNASSSHRVKRLLLTAQPLSFDDNEITDKGSINMRRIWERRSRDLERIFAENGDVGSSVLTTCRDVVH